MSDEIVCMPEDEAKTMLATFLLGYLSCMNRLKRVWGRNGWDEIWPEDEEQFRVGDETICLSSDRKAGRKATVFNRETWGDLVVFDEALIAEIEKEAV